LLFASILTLEILRQEDEMAAWSYAQKTMTFKDFDKMRSGGTDLGNLIAVMTNQDAYSDDFKTNIRVYLPELQTKAYLRSFSTFTQSQVRQFLLRLDSDLMISDPQMHQVRRAVGSWDEHDNIHKQMTWITLQRVFNNHGSQLDIYRLAKQNFTF